MASISRPYSDDRPFLGILLMLGFCILAPLGDAIVKLLGETVPLLEILTIRFLIQAVLLAVLVAVTGRSWHMTRRVFWLAWLRAVLHIAGIAAVFVSLRYLPIAEAIAIAYVMPFLMLLLGRFVLHEHIGPRRAWACAVGFVGTMLVVQPTFVDVGWPALIPLLVAVIFSAFMLVTRQIARETDPVSLQAVNGVMASIVLVPLSLMIGGSDDPMLHYVVLLPRELYLLAAIGLTGTAAHLLMTWSLRFAPSATLAPMQYLEIPVATLVGWVIFSDLPNGLAAIGICVTMAAGLYIVMHERSMARTMPPEQP
ncbi:DMT family transporter [Phaeobacter sp. J2-8]|uniref:DMT family transporter n=1 Tax=Phaeobacter sp. J2-8 TaxID=2931394 RepID=UPI002453CFED|nr:DMT family transporter [Phaeobacter sp. J2-8]